MKKIKKILIFTFISVFSAVLFFVPVSAKATELNDNMVIENVPKSIKLYLVDYIYDTDGAYYYFDFTFLDSYYNYFIFDLTQYQDSINIIPVVYDYHSWEVFSLDGFYESRREYLDWEIYFGSSFHNSYYVLATNYDYIYNLDNNMYYQYVNGYQIGYDEGYVQGKADGINEGHQPAYNAGYDWGFQKGKEAGEKIGFNIGYDKAVDDMENYNFTSLLAQVFTGLGSFLAIELLPNITFGAIFAVPLVFGIIFFIIGKRGGKDD